MLGILGLLNTFGHARDRAAGKRRSRAQQPCVNRLEVRALMASFQGLGANTVPTAVSADGSVVVGTENGAGLAFYWTQSNGMSFLLDSSGNRIPGVANGVSGNGSVIVGNRITYGGIGQTQAFRWANGVAATIPQLV